MAFAPRRSIDVSTTIANTGFAHTRTTETEWVVGLNVREPGRSTRDMDYHHRMCA